MEKSWLLIVAVKREIKHGILILYTMKQEVVPMQEDHSGLFQSRKGDILWIENRRKNF